MKNFISIILVVVISLYMFGCAEKTNGEKLESTESVSEGLELIEYSYGYDIVGIGVCTDTDIIIPSKFEGKNVVAIADNAFKDCTTLTSITLPDSIKTIGEDAFVNCESLTRINIPNGVISIGESAFAACDTLTSITIPNSVKEIGKFLVRGCDSLYDIYYKGTQEQWHEAKNKWEEFEKPLEDVTVHCSDGDIYYPGTRD